MTTKEKPMKINDLLQKTQDAFDDVEAKAAVRDKTQAAYDAAVKAHVAAIDVLSGYQEQLNAIFGEKKDPRVRQG